MHVIDQLKIGGAQKLLVTFAREASERGMDMHVLCLRSEKPNWIIHELESRGAGITFLPARKLLSPHRFILVMREIRRLKPDVVHAHLTYANILGCLAAFMVRVPSVATLHLAGPDRRYSRLRELFESIAVRFFASEVVAVGPQTARQHARRLGERSIRVLLNAVEQHKAAAGTAERIRKEFGIAGAADVLISVGRFSIVKAFHVLIKAFAIYRAVNPDAVLMLVGDGAMRGEWEQLAEKLGESRAVYFTGFRDDVPNLLAASDLYVCSSTVEGTPLAVMEAVMVGLPVVSTDVGDLPEILHSDFSRLVEPEEPQELAEAIHEVMSDESRRAEMARTAREYALAHYSSTVWMDALLRIYEMAVLHED